MTRPHSHSAGGGDNNRSSVWLPLLKHLSSTEPNWAVLKHPDSAFTGHGDIDSVAPRCAWRRIEAAFLDWARQNRLGHVIACPHAPGWLHLIALDPHGGHFYELDINERKLLLGSTLYIAEDLLPLSVQDPRGFRRLRPGAEGLFKLIHNGTRRGGRRNARGLRDKDVRSLLEADPLGTRLAARHFGWAETAILRGCDALMAGKWDQPAMLFTELRSLSRAATEPRGIAWRLRFRIMRRKCPLLRVVFAGRQPPADVADWLREVRRTHDVWPPTDNL